jgi:predicted solute-binding protein
MIRIGLTEEIYSIPLVLFLEKFPDINTHFIQSLSENNQELINENFDAGQISLMDYAKNSPDLVFVI